MEAKRPGALSEIETVDQWICGSGAQHFPSPPGLDFVTEPGDVSRFTFMNVSRFLEQEDTGVHAPAAEDRNNAARPGPCQ